MTTLEDWLHGHPRSRIHKTDNQSESKKAWVKAYHAITNLHVHTRQQQDGSVIARFDGPFLPEMADDDLRKSQPARETNTRQWRMDTEGDVAMWFGAEIDGVVLSGWSQYPVCCRQRR